MQTQVKKEEITFKEVFTKVNQWFQLLKSKWKSLLIFIILGGLAGYGFFLISQTRYRAEVTFVLNSDKGKMGAYSGLAAQFGLNMGGMSSGVFSEDNNIMALMRSRSMGVRTLLTPFDNSGKTLADRYLDFMGLRKQWKSNKLLADINFSNYKESTSRVHDSVLTFIHKWILVKNLIVGKPDTKSDIISITTETTDELFSKLFSERLLEIVSSYYVETQTKKAQENVLILNHQVDSVRSLLNSALAGVAVSSDANPNMNPAFQRLRVPSQRRMIDVEMSKGILEELVQNLEVAKVTLRRETPLVQIIDSPVLPLESTKIKPRRAIVYGAFIGLVLMVVIITVRAFIRSVMR